MRRLAESAELSTRTLYNLYGAKEDILFALADECLDAMDDLSQAQEPQDPIARSRELLRASLRQLEENAELFRALLRSGEFQQADPRLPGLMRRARTVHQSALEAAAKAGLLDDRVSPRLLAHQIQAAYAHGVRQWGRGLLDHDELLAHVLHAWALLLLAAARPEARERLLAEVGRHEPRVAATIERIDALADAAPVEADD